MSDDFYLNLPSLAAKCSQQSIDLRLKEIQETQAKLIKSIAEIEQKMAKEDESQRDLLSKIKDEIMSIMYESRLEKKLKRLKDEHREDQENMVRKMQKVEQVIRDNQSITDHQIGRIGKQIEKIHDQLDDQIVGIGEQIEKIHDQLGSISHDTSIAAQYADYRQTMEDAKADFHLRQNS